MLRLKLDKTYGSDMITWLSIICMFFFLKLSVPFFVGGSFSNGFPLTPILMGIFSVYYLSIRYDKLPQLIINKIRQVPKVILVLLIVYFVLLLCFYISSISHYSNNYIVRSTVRRSIIFNIYALFFFLEINHSNISEFLDKFTRYTALAFSVISIYALLRMYLSYAGIDILTPTMILPTWHNFLSTLVTDYNFFALGVLAGIFSILYQWSIGKSYPMWVLGIMSLTVYFTGSRRAFIVLVSLLIYFWIKFTTKLVREVSFTNILYFFIPILLCVSWLYGPTILQDNFSRNSKESFFSSLGWSNYKNVSNYIILPRYKYYTLINSDIDIGSMREKFFTGGQSVHKNIDIDSMRKKFFTGEQSHKWYFKYYIEDIIPTQDKTVTISPTSGGRFVRFKYALELFSKRTWKSKFFGDGPSYFRLFFIKFINIPSNEAGLSHLHQPFLSQLLYSGILGTILLLIIYSIGIINFKFQNWITIGLFASAHFFNHASLDLIWSNYHFPFMLIFSLKLFEIFLEKDEEWQAKRLVK